MKTQNSNAIGGQWLCEAFGLQLINPLAVVSQIGGRRHTNIDQGIRTESYQEGMRPESTLRGHLVFHLKHEVAHLELLSRLFERCDKTDIEAWVNAEPTSQYARRTGFLFEWFTGRRLEVGLTGGNYVDALDGETVVVSASSEPVRRWMVRDNLPGTPLFCPTVRLTDKSTEAMALDCSKLISDLKGEFGDDMLMRSAVWLTLRESKSSFQIEGEADKGDRIQRFAEVLHQHTGRGEPPLNQQSLAMLQGAILGSSTSLERPGIRTSPVFVGETARYQEVIHYVAPPFEDVPGMLEGLATYLKKTASLSAVMRSAVAAFGFVYIHPLADGNGRVHRFLVNDVLRRDGAVQEPLIIPVSGLIAKDSHERRAYDEVLDSFSKPLMSQVSGACKFESNKTKYDDGIVSNFVFSGNHDARHAWRFMDLTKHVQFLSDVIERTITQDMRAESAYLRSHYAARAAIKEVIEMPDSQVDRVLRSLEHGNGVLPNVLAKEIPALQREGVWEDIKAAVQTAFAEPPATNAQGVKPGTQSEAAPVARRRPR